MVWAKIIEHHIKKGKDPKILIKRWEKELKRLEKGGKMIPSYFKVDGEMPKKAKILISKEGNLRRVTRAEEIGGLKEWIKEYKGDLKKYNLAK
jgi:hypothetical protein